MLRWIFGSVIVLAILGGGVALGLYYYVATNANTPGTDAAAAYEKVTERKLKSNCAHFLEAYPDPEHLNTEAQYEATCKCFADNMFEKLRDVPPEQLDAYLDQPEINKKATVILVKCADQAGFN